MNQLTIFNYGESPIRTLQNDGEIWWMLADVCKVLEIKNPRNVAARLDDDEKGVRLVDTLGGAQNITVINEPGLYSVILRSDKPEAKQFKRWVTHDVLPSIRKNGSYGRNYDKMEIAKMIVSCKSVGAVKAIMTLFDITPPTEPFYVPQNANNSVSLFLKDDSSLNLTTDTQKKVYKAYINFCEENNLVPSTLANFSKELHRQTGMVVRRYRVNGILTGFYKKEW